jgi:long-chain acyl-CoA synthetase
MGMLAAGVLGGYAMPVYSTATPDEIRHFMHETHVRFVLAEDQEQVDKVLDLGDQGATIKNIIYDEPRGLTNYSNPGLISWEKLQAIGADRLRAEPKLRNALIERALPDGPAVFVHSSGTTGKPKGVVLSHRNFLAGVRNAHRGGAFTFGETILAYLPMAWWATLPSRSAPVLRCTSPSISPNARKRCCTTCARSRPLSIWRHPAAGTTC